MASAVLPLSSYQADFVTGKEALHAYIEILAVGLVGPVGNISKQSKCQEPILPSHFHGQVAVYKTDTFWSRGPVATTCKVPQMTSLCWEVAGLNFLGEIFPASDTGKNECAEERPFTGKAASDYKKLFCERFSRVKELSRRTSLAGPTNFSLCCPSRQNVGLGNWERFKALLFSSSC